MPNRILKESIRTSDSINALSWFEEVLFYRLIVSCDDYGRFDGRIAIIKGTCFPLKDITNKDIEKALNKLVAAGLVGYYEVEEKPYLQLSAWEKHQTIRAKKSKYPSADEGNMISHESICKQMQADVPVIQSNPNQNPNTNPNQNQNPDYQLIVDMYNDICVSFPRCQKLSDSRKKAIKARLNKYTVEDFRTVFEEAEKSDFLKGSNDRNWMASFDWMLNDSNMAKILDGNYKNRTKETSSNGGIDWSRV